MSLFHWTIGRERKKQIIPYLLIAPVVLYYTLFWLFPVIQAVSGSFLSAPLSKGGQLTFQNYMSLFKDPLFYQALFNTAFIVLISVTLEFFLAFGLALLINMKFKGSGFFLFLALIPMSLPAVAVGAMWNSGLATYGWLNSFLISMGFIEASEKFTFLAGTNFQRMILIILVDAWQVIPYMMVILLSGMQSLKPEMFEAGYVFGGNKIQVLRKITIPLMKQTITTAMILRIIAAIQIWLIIVMLFGFNRLPVLLEQIVLNVDQYIADEFFRKGMALSVLVSLIVSSVSYIYLKVSGAFDQTEGKGV
ncbi:carbohydrate ABC transporter permease [Oceanispirochaeta sp.]|jgi:multiple sugar transport system permease protein|uniref:carbohydrate ABC transporter permease n=1 Tax=Oceanispirochaeta sp. TaxID=2035350 RepID=UPI0026128263|nr:sugar ABC transporter permease [Oceanispirochaeta sp.]MDA3956376.1 sugar ABC transporter permease [Oceanispirochaeta sp.]